MVASQALRLNFWILAIPKFQYLHSYIKFSHLRLIYSRTSLLRSRYLRPKYMVMWNSPKDKSFFANHTFLQSTFFPVFMSCIHGPKKKSGKCILGGFSSAIYIFFPGAPLPFRMQHGAGKDTLGSARYGDMLCHPRTVGTSFRFLMTSCLRHISHGQHIALADDRAMRNESLLFPQRRQKASEPDEASDQMH